MRGAAGSVVDALLASDEPSLRWKTRVAVLGEPADSRPIRALREEIRKSPRVKALTAHRDSARRITSSTGVYAKWQGAHWILATLADIGYPEGDADLVSTRDAILDTWLHEDFYLEFEARAKTDAYKKPGVPVMEGRHRRCASQQGYALYFLITLGLENERVHDLVERLLHWRWPDGGWNCDKEPSAAKSTFIHTIHSMRGLYAYGRRFRKPAALAAAKTASEILLARQLFKRRSDGSVMKAEFIKLHYPLYWHYDFLFGLKVMAEMGQLADSRCESALDLLERKRLPDGGWPAEARYYHVMKQIQLHGDWVDWGGVNSRKMNPWVTADALSVLARAGRWKP